MFRWQIHGRKGGYDNIWVAVYGRAVLRTSLKRGLRLALGGACSEITSFRLPQGWFFDEFKAL